MSQPLAVTALLLNATAWGLAWWPLRLLAEAGLHSLWATALVYLTATAGITFAFRRSLRSGLRDARGLWWLMIAAGLTNASFNWAVTLTEVARVALLFYLMPIWAALLARWLLKEPLTWSVGARIAVALTGAAVVFMDPHRTAGAGSWMADALAVIAGVTFAANTVLLRRFAGQSSGAVALAMFGGGALLPILVGLTLTLAGYAVPVPAAPGPWIGIVLATALAFVFGNLALQYGAARLPANTAALIMLTEVAVAAVSSALFAGEALTTRALVGGALIVVAAASSMLTPAREPPKDRAVV